MKKLLFVLSIICLFGCNKPTDYYKGKKQFMVNDLWVYGVDDYREIHPEFSYKGQNVNGWECIDIVMSQTKKLNYKEYIDAKNKGMIIQEKP